MIYQQVLGYTELIENKKADFAARDKPLRGRKKAENQSSLAHIRENLAKMRATEITNYQVARKKITKKKTQPLWLLCSIDKI